MFAQSQSFVVFHQSFRQNYSLSIYLRLESDLSRFIYMFIKISKISVTVHSKMFTIYFIYLLRLFLK